MSDDKKLTTRAENFSDWYNELVLRAELADYSPVRGCMVIRPHGYGVWERMQRALDDMFKATGHVNAYFPLFIPESFLSKEAQHVEGFAPECAVVTHGGGKQLEERLVVRPTSETIIYSMFAKWVQSYRDLPLLYNQWANVVRWEMRTRLFLRTTEFLWQEGHTAHETAEEAVEETRRMLDVYARFAEEWMSMPVVRGVKTPNERFAGALDTYCIEAMMQDGKALQAGTSHFLGQNFARAFDVKFATREGGQELVWATSWGVSTRLMGALIMSHSDDAGLVLPPRLAPIEVVLVPIYKGADQMEDTVSALRRIADALRAAGIRVKLDDDDTKRSGWKFAEYELKGVPLRIAMGPRDLENGTVELARRDTREKTVVPVDGLTDRVRTLLDDIQTSLLTRAAQRTADTTHTVDSWDDFVAALDRGGFVRAHWDGTPETEDRIKDETKATIRCIPLDTPDEPGQCVRTGAPSARRVLFARAY